MYSIFRECACKISYLACNAHALNSIVVCGLTDIISIIAPHYLINSTTFGKSVIEYTMRVLIFCAKLVLNICYSKKTPVKYYHKSTLVVE
jgi:hypothetical protein